MNNDNNIKLMLYVKKLIKKTLKKEIKSNIDIMLFEDISEEFQKLINDFKINDSLNLKSYNSKISNSDFDKWSSNFNELKNQKEKLDQKIIKRVTELKLFKKIFFTKFFEKLNNDMKKKILKV